MRINNFRSLLKPKFNAGVLSGIDSLTRTYAACFPKGWRAIVRLQDDGDTNPYYCLDVSSDTGDIITPELKIATLNKFPERMYTGYNKMADLLSALEEAGCKKVDEELYDSVVACPRAEQLSRTLHDRVQKELGITLWHGGIRIPYKIMVTRIQKPCFSDEELEQRVDNIGGQMQVAFGGAKEYVDVNLSFFIARQVQGLIKRQWKRDQVSYDLSGLRGDPQIDFARTAIRL